MSSRRAAQPLIGDNLGATAAITDAVDFFSAAANIGESTNVAIMVKTDGAVTFVIQAADDTLGGAGRNGLSSGTSWFDYVRADSFETASGVEGNTAKIVFAGAGAVCIDLSPFAPKYLRLYSADGNARNVYAAVVTSE